MNQCGKMVKNHFFAFFLFFLKKAIDKSHFVGYNNANDNH